jgi:ribosomal protein S18 acetylase RimI-like enzyme
VTAPDVWLRPASAEDRGFFARVYAAGRAEELAPVPFSAAEKEAFLAQQFEAQSVHYSRHYGDASYDVILVEGNPAGRLIVHRTPEHILIVDIALLPEQRGRGVGTSLLLPILEEGNAAGVPVQIHVERNNRALRLYERLGFAPIGDDGIYLTMERPASPPASS